MSTNTQIAAQLGGWSLAEILPAPDDATIQAELDKLNAELDAFEARRAALDAEMAPSLLVDIVRDYEQLVEHLYRIVAYC